MAEVAYISQSKNCDVCKFEKGKTVAALYDARMTRGSGAGQWANLCQSDFEERTDQRLGTGYGQRLIVGNQPEKSDAYVRSQIFAALEDGDMEAAFDACGDRDPMEFL